MCLLAAPDRGVVPLVLVGGPPRPTLGCAANPLAVEALTGRPVNGLPGELVS